MYSVKGKPFLLSYCRHPKSCDRLPTSGFDNDVSAELPIVLTRSNVRRPPRSRSTAQQIRPVTCKPLNFASSPIIANELEHI